MIFDITDTVKIDEIDDIKPKDLTPSDKDNEDSQKKPALQLTEQQSVTELASSPSMPVNYPMDDVLPQLEVENSERLDMPNDFEQLLSEIAW